MKEGSPPRARGKGYFLLGMPPEKHRFLFNFDYQGSNTLHNKYGSETRDFSRERRAVSFLRKKWRVLCCKPVHAEP